MPDRPRLRPAVAWGALTAATTVVATLVTVDTVRTVVSLHSPLPWFDDWNSVNLFRDWSLGSSPASEALFSQFGEHRPSVPRLVFFADDLFFRGRGWLALGAILMVQAAHAGLLATILAGAASRGAGRWAVVGLVVALMFSLRQAPNFASAFQLQFVGVFAAATLAFVLFGRVAARAEAGLPAGAPLAGSLIAATVATFSMANGLLCGPVLVALALTARLRRRIVAICGLASALLAIAYLQGYRPASDHTPLSDALRQPMALVIYAVTYLGNLAGEENPGAAVALGSLGVAATAAAIALLVRRDVEPLTGLPLVGVMLFCLATAIATATGRVDFGTRHALEARYVTGSVTFWSAQLCFWSVAAPARVPRFALAVVGAWLAVVLVGAQSRGKPVLVAQKFAQDQAADLLRLGLDDPAAILRSAWDDETVQRDATFLRERGLSIFAEPDAALVGRPLAEAGRVAPAETCSGAIDAAASDPRLGRDGVRVAGHGWNAARNRRLRRILLVDASGTVAGLAVSGDPHTTRADWRGFAVAPLGTDLAAYGVLDRDALCPIGAPRPVAAD